MPTKRTDELLNASATFSEKVGSLGCSRDSLLTGVLEFEFFIMILSTGNLFDHA
jgi:hypothetical protein